MRASLWDQAHYADCVNHLEFKNKNKSTFKNTTNMVTFSIFLDCVPNLFLLNLECRKKKM